MRYRRWFLMLDGCWIMLGRLYPNRIAAKLSTAKPASTVNRARRAWIVPVERHRIDSRRFRHLPATIAHRTTQTAARRPPLRLLPTNADHPHSFPMR